MCLKFIDLCSFGLVEFSLLPSLVFSHLSSLLLADTDLFVCACACVQECILGDEILRSLVYMGVI